jgi:hypothetical protein
MSASLHEPQFSFLDASFTIVLQEKVEEACGFLFLHGFKLLFFFMCMLVDINDSVHDVVGTTARVCD